MAASAMPRRHTSRITSGRLAPSAIRADLLRALHDGVSEDAVDADRREQTGDGGKDTKQDGVETRPCKPTREPRRAARRRRHHLRVPARRRDGRHRCRPVTPLEELRVRDVARRGGTPRFRRRPALGDADESIGLGIRQRLQQHGVDNAQDGGGGADAERERQHGSEGESRRASQPADRVGHIAAQVLEPGERTLVAVAFLCLLDTAEGEAGPKVSRTSGFRL